ncbi:hypothetical protein NA56DRAFT_754739 [Hyaloscypha hepaticicola]|uniref:Uncharacterized protein n=1 Tax=Hyaloscypha hepaticicola TaxID=2082293 RepID=A0A2J6PKE7_9HELO|nr:hypothetical protein NA56DRAFT_754739 [Hyaloscypha hepaticicola]
MPSQAQPIHAVTVESTPAKAKGIMVGLIKARVPAVEKDYNLVHVANCEAIREVKPVLTSLVIAPQVLICSSKLFDDEEEEIREISQRLLPDIKLIMVPHDLHATGGGNAVVEFLVEQITESRLPTRA